MFNRLISYLEQL